ncbi:hypothetical protein [Kineosporia sp. A_224]|uniref:hypothetical protein n=1 Tax=Kineosporia sp. A_224 TaxID=1962180 RepID=UPI000B4AF956|nr:hypothetical protein [Kineosporia sp. A_224]
MSTRELAVDVQPAETPTRPAARWPRTFLLLVADAGVVVALWFAATHVVTPVAGLLRAPQWPVAILAGIGAGVGGLLLVVRLHRRS